MHRKRQFKRLLPACSAVLLGGMATHSLSAAQLSSSDSVFNTSESDTFTSFTTQDLIFNTSLSNTPLQLNLSSGSASPPLLNVSFGGLVQNGNYAAVINGGILISSLANTSAQSPFTEIDASVAGSLTLNSALGNTGNAPLLLTVNGAGTLILNDTSAANNISGGIALESGRLRISSDLNLGGNAGNTNSIQFGGGTLEASAAVSFSQARIFTVDSGGGTFFADAGTTSTIPGPNQLVTGTTGGTFTKDGPGALILGSSNSFSGPVIINNGTLQLNDLNSLGGVGSKGTITLDNGAQLTLRTDGPFVADSNGNQSASFGNNIVANGASTTIDIGYQASNGTNTGNMQLGALNFPVSGILNVTNILASNRSLEFTGTVTIGQGNNSAAAIVNNTPDLRFSSQVTGNGSLTKTGPGSLYLGGTAPNTFSGYTNVSAGTLVLDKTGGNVSIPGNLTINGGTVLLQTSGQISADSNVLLQSGTLNVNGQSDTVLSLNNSGGTLLLGGGNLSVTSSNTTDLTGGTTQVDNGSTLTSQHLVISGGLNQIQPGGSIQIQSSGLDFISAAAGNQSNPAIVLQGGSNNAGLLRLAGPLTFTAYAGSSATGMIQSNQSTGQIGTIDLNGATRTFTINPFPGSLQSANSINMMISASLTDGTIDKEGAGVLQLSGSNSFGGGTSLGNGTLQLTGNGTLGAGPLTLAGGTLSVNTATESLGALIIAAGKTSTVELIDGTSNAVDLTFNSYTQGAGGQVNFDLSSSADRIYFSSLAAGVIPGATLTEDGTTAIAYYDPVNGVDFEPASVPEPAAFLMTLLVQAGLLSRRAREHG